MTARCALVWILLAAAPLAAQVNTDDLTPLDLAYTCELRPDLRTLAITLDVGHVNGRPLRVAMPNWTPGSYRIQRFGRQVRDLRARNDEGKDLAVTRTDHQTWSVAAAGARNVRVTYAVENRRPRFSSRGPGKPTGMHFQAPAIFAYVVGAKNTPVRVRYVLPDGWKVANGLLRTADEFQRRARDYDTFIDSPTILGIFKQQDFEVNGTPFSCVYFDQRQRYDFDMPAFTDLCRRIVTYQGRLFGTFPFPNYVFLFVMGGGGGLEHLNSTSIGLSPGGMKRDVNAGVGVTAHEFFHTWNVKRIRPVTLGPFEYEHENYTRNLWVSEGWTSYYGDLTLVRTGIRDREWFLRSFAGKIGRELSKESRKEHSVEWASRNVWHRRRGEPPRVDYYSKGEILGAMIDLEIRAATGNRKSLDDVLRFMNRWFAERGVGFQENDVERACTAISNHDFSEFFIRHVHGTLDPPLERCLAHAGLEYRAHRLTAELPFTWRQQPDGLRVFSRRRGAGDGDGQPTRGDLVVELDGRKATDAFAFLAACQAGQEVKLAWSRDGKRIEGAVKLVARERVIPSIKPMKDPSSRQRLILEDWLGVRK